MSEIKRKEKFDNAQLTLSVDMETLHPCGYVYKDGERYPILLVFFGMKEISTRVEIHTPVLEH